MEVEPSLPDLMEHVAAAIPHKWREVGIELGIQQAYLDVLRPRPHCLKDNHRAFCEIFELWRRRVPCPYKWSTIIEVLKTTRVDEDSLSAQLTSRITGNM